MSPPRKSSGPNGGDGPAGPRSAPLRGDGNYAPGRAWRFSEFWE